MAGNFENVGYSKPGLECIYNILIMEKKNRLKGRKQTIIAMGAGASTKIVFQNETEGGQAGRIERIENVKDVTNYIQRIDEMIERKQKSFSVKIIFNEWTGGTYAGLRTGRKYYQ